jgi:hypothetical protein
MKRIILGFIVSIGLALACSRDTGGIWVKLEQPMYNQFNIRRPNPENLLMELPQGERTTIFDTEQMTSLQATVRGGDVSYRRSQFRIAVVDYNNNGLFNEVGIDKLLLERYGSDSTVLIYPLKPNFTTLQSYTQFRVDHQFFEVAYVDEKGHSLEIYPVGRSDALEPMILNTRLPNIKLRDREGQVLPLGELKEEGKPLVIVLWQNRHHVWDRQVEKLIVFHQQHPELMTLIGIHMPGNYFGDINLNSIDGWLRDRMPLYWGEAGQTLELNNGDQFPGVILYDAEGVWQGSGLKAGDVLTQVAARKHTK